MSNEEHSHPNSPQQARVPTVMSLEQAHITRKDDSILTSQQNMTQISRQLEQMAAHFTNFQGNG